VVFRLRYNLVGLNGPEARADVSGVHDWFAEILDLP